MDARINNMGEESAKFIFLDREKLKLAELEKIPQPKRTQNFESWEKEKETILKQEFDQVCQNIVAASEREISSVFSEDSLKETVWKKFQNESAKLMRPYAMLAALPTIRKLIEDTIWGKGFEAWSHRLDGLKQRIADMESKLPQPFSLSLINTEKYPDGSFRFPLNGDENDRVRQLSDGTWVDLWLQKDLGEKKVIPFEPQERYIPYLKRYHPEVYWATAEREKAEARKQPSPVVNEEPPPTPPPIPPEQAKAIHGFFNDGAEETGTLRGRISRIYKK